MKTATGFALLVACAALAGCMVGPNYHAPQMAMPANWGEPLENGLTNRETALVAWWTNFDDPELDSLIQRAVGSNYDLRMADARLLEARAQREASFAGIWPTVNATGSYTRQRNSQNAFLNGALNTTKNLPVAVNLENNLYQAGFDASWQIDLFGGQRRALQAANANLAASYYDRADILVSLLAEVAGDYIQLRGLQDRLVILHSNIQSQHETVKVTRERYQGGVVSKLNVEQAAALLADLQSQLPPLETSLTQTTHQLAILLGQEPNALANELTPTAPIPPPPSVVPVGLPSDLLRQRPDVRRAERQLASSTALIGEQVAQLFPQFSLTGNAGLESVSASDWFTGGSKMWSVGPTLQWNIFDAGRIRANIRYQSAKQKEALYNYKKTVLMALQDVEDALVAYAKERNRYQSLNDEVKADQRSLDLANVLYQKGLTDFLNVLDAERSLYQAEDLRVQSQTALSENLVTVYKALGGGWSISQATSFVANQNGTNHQTSSYEQ